MVKGKAFARAKSAQKRTAREWIVELFALAGKNPKYANRYVWLARKVAMRYKVRIPRELQMKACKSCGVWFVPGKNCTIRTKPSRIIYQCACGHIARYPYEKERRS